MKWLVYLLILVNLGIFLWHFQVPSSREAQPEQGDEQVPQLVLLREYDGKQQDTQTEQPQEATTETCFSLGPFSKKDAFQQVVLRFREEKVPIQSRISKDAVQDGYWVYLPPVQDRKQAQEAIDRLREKKVRDFFLMVTGEKKNSISLGVFSKPNLAQRRMKKISALGFDVQIEKLSLPKRTYWLEWPKNNSKQPSEALMVVIYEQYKGVGRTERACQLKKP